VGEGLIRAVIIIWTSVQWNRIHKHETIDIILTPLDLNEVMSLP